MQKEQRHLFVCVHRILQLVLLITLAFVSWCGKSGLLYAWWLGSSAVNGKIKVHCPPRLVVSHSAEK
jgi:hypothetical protein